MNQSRIGSLIEAVANVVIGYGIGFVSQLIVFPLVGIEHVALHQNLIISLAFTAISLVRSYVLRRWFNARLHAASLQLAERIAA